MCNVPLPGCSLDMMPSYVDTARLLIILFHCSCLIISLHPPSYNISRCGVHVLICIGICCCSLIVDAISWFYISVMTV